MRRFSVLDPGPPEVFEVDVELRHVSEHALWYVSPLSDAASEAIASAADRFEAEIFQRVVDEIDGDARAIEEGNRRAPNTTLFKGRGRFVGKKALEVNGERISAETIVIAAGGGGIPVVLDAEGAYRKVESVIDKDLAGEKLAESVSADIYLILTNVDKVALNYSTDRQEELHRVTVSDARRYYQEGHFAGGSMGPKVLSCIDFIEFGGEVAIITGLESAARAINCDAGTRIVPDG